MPVLQEPRRASRAKNVFWALNQHAEIRVLPAQSSLDSPLLIIMQDPPSCLSRLAWNSDQDAGISQTCISHIRIGLFGEYRSR